MAFFDLNRKLQVILIASGLAVAPATGCKPPAVEPPDTPPGDDHAKQACATLGLEDMDVAITRVNKSHATVELQIKGTLPQGTELTHEATSTGFELVGSDLTVDGVTLELSHAGLVPGDTGTVLVAVTASCGANSTTLKERISLCKQAGGIKLLEDDGGVCAPPPGPTDAYTSPEQPTYLIVDPPPPPWDPPPPPPPPYDPVPPPPMDPAPYPTPIPDPVPPPQDAHTGHKPPHGPIIVDCVPDAMAPRTGARLVPGVPVAMGAIRTTIEAAALDGSTFEITVILRGEGARAARVEWSASGGALSPSDGTVVRWTAPDDGRVHIVMAAVHTPGSVQVETWRHVP